MSFLRSNKALPRGQGEGHERFGIQVISDQAPGSGSRGLHIAFDLEHVVPAPCAGSGIHPVPGASEVSPGACLESEPQIDCGAKLQRKCMSHEIRMSALFIVCFAFAVRFKEALAVRAGLNAALKGMT